MYMIYAETQMKLPFHQHSTVVKLYEWLGGTTQWFYHKDKKAPPCLISHMSEEYYLTMLKELTKQDTPLSMIMDTAVYTLTMYIAI